jgi:hypothetical protein
MNELLQWTVLPGMKLNTAMKLGLKKTPKSNHFEISTTKNNCDKTPQH